LKEVQNEDWWTALWEQIEYIPWANTKTQERTDSLEEVQRVDDVRGPKFIPS
jgi:hypothetical protein